MNSETGPVRQSGPRTDLDAGTWATAVEMCRNRYSFVAVGPRAHKDWLPGVAAVTQREVADPCGRRGRDAEQGEEELDEDPDFPFRVPPSDGAVAARWRSRLFEIPRSATGSAWRSTRR
jgi:hypothetical protein